MSLVPKIKIEIKIEELAAINAFFSIYSLNIDNNERKATSNILDLISEKLFKKQLSNRYNKTAFKLSLEFNEAYYLEKYLIDCNVMTYQPQAQKVIDKLNQKLA